MRPVFARYPVKVELVDVGATEIVLVVEAEEEKGVEGVDDGCAPAEESAQSQRIWATDLLKGSEDCFVTGLTSSWPDISSNFKGKG